MFDRILLCYDGSREGRNALWQGAAVALAMRRGNCYKAPGFEPARADRGRVWSAQKRSREADGTEIVALSSGRPTTRNLRSWWALVSPPRVFGGGTRMIRSRTTAALLRALAVVFASAGVAGASEAEARSAL